MADVSIPCALYRGGTSRGLLFLEQHLPYPRDVLAPILLRAVGSPDARQIDGVGGGTSLTSKALIVGPDRTPGADPPSLARRSASSGEASVRMLFAQIAVAAPAVDWGGNCGNMTAAVGPFAIEAGLVAAVEPVTIVTIRSVNTGVLVRAHVPVRGGRVLTDGDYAIAGVAGTAARIDLEWLDPGGSSTGHLLPTGRPRDCFVLSDRRRIDVSIVDAGNPIVFCAASDLGLTGTELPAEIESHAEVMQTLEEIRSIAAEALDIVPDRAMGTRISPGLPKVCFVGPCAPYATTAGDTLAIDTHDLHARLLSMQTAHRSYAGAASIGTAVAARLAGTVVHERASTAAGDPDTVRIAHPAGVMEVRIRMRRTEAGPHVASATVSRTARLIMSGAVWVPAELLTENPKSRVPTSKSQLAT